MVPVIDIHTHLFNALDIPVEGYLISRRVEKKRPCDLEYIIHFFPGMHVFHYLVDRMRDRCMIRQMHDETQGWYYKLLLWVFGRYMRQDLKEWEDSLTKTVVANARDLTRLWPQTDLFVPLVIDFEYWFRNSVDVPIAEQIELIYREVTLPMSGRFHGFVPFDPVRELAFRKRMNNPDGQQEVTSSLDLVKRAIREMGFIGVKLYNTLGYRPLNNSGGLTPLHRQRMAVRNEKGTYLFEGDAYDQVLRELYDYCEKDGVPITAHCMLNGIEAYPGASEHFGAADLWRPVLNEFRNIKINLAHFGWNPISGIGYGSRQNWMRNICRMLAEYTNLYTDVSHHEVMRRNKRNELIKAFRRIQTEFPDSIEKIKKRILYGSDWHVLRRINKYAAFPDRYRQIMLKTGFYEEPSLPDFLGGNAMRFLGLLPGEANYKRLDRFYKSHHMEPPAWFQNAGTEKEARIMDQGV